MAVDNASALSGVRPTTDGVVHGRDDADDDCADVGNPGVDDGDRPRLREVGVTIVVHGRNGADNERADVDNTGVGNSDCSRVREVGVTVVDCVAAPSWRGVDDVGTGLREAL